MKIKCIKEKVGEDVYNTWPRGATIALEQAEAHMTTMRELIKAAISTKNFLYLEKALEDDLHNAKVKELVLDEK